MFLHQAIRTVLTQHDKTPMTIEQIAALINKQNLYLKTNGSQVTAWNVGLRAVSDVCKGEKPIFDVLIKLRDQ